MDAFDQKLASAHAAASVASRRTKSESAEETRDERYHRHAVRYAAELVLLDDFEHKSGNENRMWYLTRNLEFLADRGIRPDPDEVDALADRWRKQIERRDTDGE